MAILLPFVLFGGNWALTGNELESSISAYYHTSMRDLLVAGLSVIGFLLMTYMSAQPKTWGTRMRWPDDDTGRNSVRPCTSPSTIAWA